MRLLSIRRAGPHGGAALARGADQGTGKLTATLTLGKAKIKP